MTRRAHDARERLLRRNVDQAGVRDLLVYLLGQPEFRYVVYDSLRIAHQLLTVHLGMQRRCGAIGAAHWDQSVERAGSVSSSEEALTFARRTA